MDGFVGDQLSINAHREAIQYIQPTVCQCVSSPRIPLGLAGHLGLGDCKPPTGVDLASSGSSPSLYLTEGQVIEIISFLAIKLPLLETIPPLLEQVPLHVHQFRGYCQLFLSPALVDGVVGWMLPRPDLGLG